MFIDVCIEKVETKEQVIYHDSYDWIDDGFSTAEESVRYQYTEGNYSCDCNRELFFCRAKGIEEPEQEDHKCGDDERFRILWIKDRVTDKEIDLKPAQTIAEGA